MLLNLLEWRSDILQEHCEELEALWNRRLRAEGSLVVDVLGLRRIDRRIEAHSDALVLAGDRAERFLEPLFGGDPPAAATAAFVVASGDAPALVERLVRAIEAASAPGREAIWLALALRCGPRAREALAGLSANPEVFAGALSVLAMHDVARAVGLKPELLLADPSPVARRLAWRAVRRLGRDIRMDGSNYQRGLAERDAGARRAALEAAVLTRHPSVLEYLRGVAAKPSLGRLDEHLLYAAIAGAADVEGLVALGGSSALGWERFRVLALCGRAPAVEALLGSMRAGDAVDAALAAAAFYRITGVSVARRERVALVPAGTEPDDFSDDIQACDLPLAEKVWASLNERMGAARWCYGVDVEATPAAELPDNIDLESRWAADLRATYALSKHRSRFPTEFWQA